MAATPGKTLEEHIGASLRHVAQSHPGLVQVRTHHEIPLLSGASGRPVFELIYRLEQEHREFIALPDVEDSADLAVNVRIMKNFSSRNRFVLIFEDIGSVPSACQAALARESVQCLSPAEFDRKVKQLNDVLVAEKICVRPRWSTPAVKRIVFG